MAENENSREGRRLRLNYRGRGSQAAIYFLKFLRMFIYESDWKVLPMSALIVGLVGMVIRSRFFVDMEGTLTGSFALVCMCIWNGCFNSVQVICRERDVIKREHRSGMHISAYVFAHMLFQALLCFVQTLITIYVLQLTGVRLPSEGLVSPLFLLDFGISVFLITYASDMMSLWISALSRNTTTAMTIMPFVLIFQLVFSGGMLSLPAWAEPATNFTISNPGLKLVGTLADINGKPFVTISDMLTRMKGEEVEGTITLGQVIDRLQNTDNGLVREFREQKLDDRMTVGSLIDMLAEDPQIQENADETISMHATVGDLLDLAGEQDVKAWLNTSAASASYRPEYLHTVGTAAGYWADLTLFVLVFAMLAVITLEFIDKDKR